MRYITQKKQLNEPEDCKRYRETTEGARYNGGNFSVPHLKEQLLKEQGYICAYCMGKLTSPEDAHVEHYCPQKSCPEKDLDYMNLLAVCDGLSESYPEREEFHHCDKTKGKDGKMNGGVLLKKLNPTEKSCETLITYTAAGTIVPADKQDEITRQELNLALNLNNKALIQRRKSAMDRALDQLNVYFGVPDPQDSEYLTPCG